MGETARPLRADARRNRAKLIAAARDTFSADGVDASLEEIARRAHVGIGTLYRHFPTRKDLFQSVYLDEVDKLCRAAEEQPGDRAPFEALADWLRAFVAYFATKRALAEALNYDSALFAGGRDKIHGIGGPLLRRAQEAGTARGDVSFDDVIRLVGGISAVQVADEEQRERLIRLAIDGLRGPGA